MTNIRFHFLDVGDGDCTLIEFPSGRIGLIDIHTNHSFGNKTIEYIKEILQKRSLFRFILTHPHQDHLHGIKDLVDAGIVIENFWHVKNNFRPDMENENWEDYKPHWNYYKNIEKKLEFNLEDHNFDYLIEDKIIVLSPSKELSKQANELGEDNDGVHRDNYVLKILHGNFSALLCGDSDCHLLTHLSQNNFDEIKNIALLKAPHHGTETHFNEDFLKKSNPRMIIFHQGKERSKNCAKNLYQKSCPNSVIGITKEHGVLVIDGSETGNYFVITNGSYDKVLGDLKNENTTKK